MRTLVPTSLLCLALVACNGAAPRTAATGDTVGAVMPGFYWGMTLGNDEITRQLPPHWSGNEQGISREFAFDSYEAGVAFALRVALMAQKVDHHPDELTIGWKKVRVTYVTHSAGGVTDKDLQAARSVNAAFEG